MSQRKAKQPTIQKVVFYLNLLNELKPGYYLEHKDETVYLETILGRKIEVHIDRVRL